MPRRTKPGFSLIELLVLIGIIALLAVVLFPLFSTKREKGEARSCLTNCKKLGAAVLQYSEDHGERLPPAAIYDRKANFAASWQEIVLPYAGTPETAICPNAQQGRPGSQVMPVWTSYAMLPNTAVCGKPDRPYRVAAEAVSTRPLGLGGAEYQGLAGYSSNPPDAAAWGYSRTTSSARTSDVRDPSRSVLLFESGMFDGWHGIFGCGYGIGYCGRFEGYDYQRVGPQARHNGAEEGCAPDAYTRGTLSVVYLDGHARTLRPAELLKTRELPGGRRVIDAHWPFE